MTATAGNPVGYVPVVDGGNPRLVTAYAMEAISGGELVFASGAAGVVSSGLNSYAATDITVAAEASGAQFMGVAMQTVASGAAVAVATRGAMILLADGTVTASYPVQTVGENAVVNLGSVAGNLAALRSIGRAYTSAGSEQYCIVDIGRS